MDHEGGAPMNGISALSKETPESSLSLSPCEARKGGGPHQMLDLWAA